MENDVDSFFYEPLYNQYYLVFWTGAIFNHNKNACGTFMNWRPDGLQTTNIIQYSYYTKLLLLPGGTRGTDEQVVASFELLSAMEIYHLSESRLKTYYYNFSTALSADRMIAPTESRNIEYTDLKMYRYPIAGSNYNSLIILRYFLYKVVLSMLQKIRDYQD